MKVVRALGVCVHSAVGDAQESATPRPASAKALIDSVGTATVPSASQVGQGAWMRRRPVPCPPPPPASSFCALH